MSLIAIVGAGMMGTALCWPLADNHHSIHLIGTPLDEDIIGSIKESGLHPRLTRKVPECVRPFSHREMKQALQGAEIIVNGVSSFGIPWFTQTVGPYLKAGTPVLAVTKGLVDLPNGDLQVIPDYMDEHLPPHLRGQISLNAIGGPCIAHELAARRHSAVVFCGRDAQILSDLRRIFATPYYHIWTSTDVIGVEVCAALKNCYALGVALIMGIMGKSGADGLAKMYNPQAAIFAQGCYEMRRFLEILGGRMEHLAWLPGPGDLFVTVYGGRTMRLGRLLGMGMPYPKAREEMAGETLESVEIILRVCRALPKLEARGIVKETDFPLMRHLHRIICCEEGVNIPWEKFFVG